MQNSSQYTHSRSKEQHTTSRMLQSLIHTYVSGENNQSMAESQATVHQMNYEDIISYRSNNSEKQQSRLVELMEKKESQLKTLETFLIKEFQQINEHKQKHALIKTHLQNLSLSVINLKNETQSYKELKNELQQIKQFINAHVLTLFQTFAQQKQADQQRINEAQSFIERSNLAFQQSKQIYEDQINHLKSVIDRQSDQIQELKVISQKQAQEITKLNEQLTHNPMTNSTEPFKLEQQHLNKAIEKKESLRHLAEEDLQVSFSADKNNHAKQLVNAIFHLRSNESLLNNKEEGSDNKNVGEQQRVLTSGFNNILLKGSTSSQSGNQNELNENQDAKSPKSPAQHSDYIQTSQVRRINSSANQFGNDSSSAINKLDVFSELNQVEYSQDDNISNYREYEDEKYSEIEFRNMRKAKISRSMKAHRNPGYNGQIISNEQVDRHSEIRNSTNTAHKNEIKHTQSKPVSPKQQNTNKRQKQQPIQIEDPHATPIEQSFHKKAPTPSREQNSPRDSLESPNKKKKPHRYNYCRLYEEQEIKEIQNINNMCNHLILNDMSNPHVTSASRLTPFSTFDKVSNLSKQFTPTRKSRELSPKRSYSKLQPSRYDLNLGMEAENLAKTFVRSGNQSASSISNSKKPLTIQIPASPQRTQPLNERGLPNPYLKLENHLHQISCQQFSPTMSRYMNERTNSGYLDRSDHKSRTSYTDLRSEARGQNRRDELVWDKKQSTQELAYQNNSYQHQNKSRMKERQRVHTTYDEQIISNNMDRKEYIKSKIEMIKRKNTVQPNIVTKSPNKISFLKSEEPQGYLSKKQLERPIISRQATQNHNRSMYEHNEEHVKGYDFNEDKFEKEMMEKSRRTDRNSQLQNSTISKVDKSRDVSRVSYANNGPSNNNTYTKNEKLGQIAKQNLRKSSINPPAPQQENYNDIYQQLNHNMTPQSSQTAQQRIPSVQQSISKKTLNRPTQPTRQSVSPLRPITRNTNTMYLPQTASRQMRKSTLVTETVDEKYNEDNLYRHPYMIERKRNNVDRTMRYDDNVSFENSQMFRRF